MFGLYPRQRLAFLRRQKYQSPTQLTILLVVFLRRFRYKPLAPYIPATCSTTKDWALCHIMKIFHSSIHPFSIQRRCAMPMQRGGPYSTVSYTSTPFPPPLFISRTTMYSASLLSVRFAIVIISIRVRRYRSIHFGERGGKCAAGIDRDIPIVLYNLYML